MTQASHFWDERYGRASYFYGTAANVFLTESAHLIAPGGAVLSIGDGEGRNGVWLAERRFKVTTIDISPVAVAKARQLAHERGVDCDIECGDLTTWMWPEAAYDAVIAIFVHFVPVERVEVHARLLNALKPGALLIAEMFHPRQQGLKSGGPPTSEMLCDRAVLAADFAACEILLADEVATVLNEGRHSGRAEVTRFIARKRGQ